MSLKIYDAYIYRGRSKDFAAVLGLSRQIRERLAEHGARCFYAKAAHCLAELVDRHAIGALCPDDVKPGESFVMAVHRVAEAAMAEVERGIRSPGWDFSAEWTFFMTDGRLLLRLFAEREMTDSFEKWFPQFRDYHYHNCSERPDSISAREWRRRRLDWSRAHGHGVPCTQGLSMRLWGTYDRPTVGLDRVLPLIRPRIERARALAEALELNAYVARRVPDPRKSGYHRVCEALRDWQVAKTTPQVKARLRRRTARILPLLTPARKFTREVACRVPVPPEPSKPEAPKNN